MVNVRIRVQLGKKVVKINYAQGQHQGLVAVVPCPEIPFAECFGHGHLGNFLAVAKDAEFGPAFHDFHAPQYAGVAAFDTQTVIADNLFGG